MIRERAAAHEAGAVHPAGPVHPTGAVPQPGAGRPMPAGAPAATAEPGTRRPLIGVIGGMGPLASTELLNTVYGLEPPEHEQLAARILLWSDPAVADRTTAIRSGTVDLVRTALEDSVDRLLTAGADRVVVACITAHPAIRLLPERLRSRCVSLVDLVFEQLAQRPGRHLVLCTRGSVLAGVFTDHERWPEFAHRLVLPDEEDQEQLHEHIYRLKRNADRLPTIDFVRALLPAYGAAAFVAGCTELHLVTRAIEDRGLTRQLPSIDPMTVIAQRIRDGAL
ncbi:aspartate/glutamate racemase family protein [Kitasatospora sp. NPDC085464]|uniref:aspartate/glutamate racemase family protein n=1 Tax=Kitasatospora sp. NPDC085464 TaxID=3364063 RepID=UPI0037C76DF6